MKKRINQIIKVSREELISRFKNLNDVLRSEGLRAGIERFSEFANILFLKLLSEDSEKSWWNSIKSQSNDDMIGYINGYVIEQIQNKYGGDVFTPILLKNPQTLRHIIDAIDPLVLSTIDTDIKGDAFEYFLEKTTSTENDLGEYFTPRNIVKTIISLVDPKFKETVYDPFCGTGGFLTEAFNYIKENTIIESSEDLKRLKCSTFYGREITSTARIAKMNMILHGNGHSGIQEINTLTNPDYILSSGKLKNFDVVVTNIPFSQTLTRKVTENGKTKTENNISPLYYNGIAKNNGDAACVLHCLRALKEGGRMALVVPEGFLFRKDIAEVRKFLLSKAQLQSIISLPQGTFLPYTGVKTDILYFTNAHKPNNQKHYWFFEAKNIGVSLDNHKRKIKGDNDLKKIESSDIKKICDKPDLQDNILEIGFEIIDLEKVKNNNYNLVGNVYRENIENSKCRTVKLLDVCSLLNGYAFKTNNFKDEESVDTLQVVRIGDINKDSGLVTIEDKVYHQKTGFDKFIIQYSDILIAMTGATVGKVGLYNTINTKALLNQRVGLLKVSSGTLKSYIYYILRSQKFYNYCQSFATGMAQGNISAQQILDFIIPLPSLDEQQGIVDELDSYQKILDGAKQIIANWKPIIDIDSGWETVRIRDVCEIRPIKPKLNSNLEVSFIDMATMPINGHRFPHKEVKKVSEVEKGYTYFAENDVLLAKITPCFENGKCGIATHLKNSIGFGSTEFIVFRCNNQILPEYLYFNISNYNFRTTGKKFMSGTAGQQRLSLDFVKNYQFALPPLYMQQEIVKQLENERNMINQQKEIIKLFQSKIDSKLNSIWQTNV